MSTKVNVKPSSYRDASTGRWVPSGTVIYRDSVSTLEVTKTYKSGKHSRSAANDYFLEKTKAS